MAVVDAGFFPLQQLIQYYQSSKEHQFQPKDEFVNTCQYTEYPNKKPPILHISHSDPGGSNHPSSVAL
ncbi:unnamed protein product [Rhizophagus irregularis]|nr:unnamed protein product [Rhizophagus irregularis]